MFKDRPRERQIEFPPMQTHPALVTAVSLGLALACIVVVIIILLVHPSGSFIGPW
ncbi:MAG: hypothetical protein ACRDNE_17040 [Gaiellaceae bacterium]